MSNATASIPNKTVIEVTNESHQRLRDGASKTGNSMKRFTALILEYALGKFENGEIGLREPVIEEVPQEVTETIARKLLLG